MNEHAPMTVWYKIDPRRASVNLLMADSPSLFVILMRIVGFKLLRINPPPLVGIPLDPQYRPIELEQIPAAAQRALIAIIDECRRHSFQLAYCQTLDFLRDSEGYAANLLHASGRIRSTAIWTRVGRTVESGCAFTSRMRDGAIYSTSNLRRSSDLPRGIYALTYPGASIGEMFSNHQKLLQKLGEQAAESLTAEQLPAESKELLRRIRAFSLARGALKPMTQAEVERLTIVTAELVPEAGDSPFRSPREDRPDAAPRSLTVWRWIGNGACFGFVLGALGGWLFGPENLPREKDWLVRLLVFGWILLPPAVGAVMGWLAWRRVERRTARTPFSS